MIIWINGAFGSGKTTVATLLSKKLTPSFMYDPENVGYFLWQNEPECIKCKENFQNEPLWRSFNYQMLKNIAENYDGDVIVPMTLADGTYYDEIIGRLRADSIKVSHFVLGAKRETLLSRLIGRGDGADSWAAEQIDRCIAAYESGLFEGIIETDDKSPESITDIILEEIK